MKSNTMLRNLCVFAFACVIGIAGVSIAAANNTAPKANIVGQNGLAAPQTLSTDPQIGSCVFDSTGVTVTSATTTTFADATHFPCSVQRGALVDVDASGFETVSRNGLYKVSISGSCTGVTTETGEIVAQISNDGGTTFSQISGAQCRTKFLTGTLQQNIACTGLTSVSQTSTNLAAGNVVIAMRGSSSGGSAMTCANGGGLLVERVDQAQPVTYP